MIHAPGVLATLLVLLGVSPAVAQRVEPIRVGQNVAATLSERDFALSNGTRFRAYEVRAEEGKRYVVTARSSDFLPVVVVAKMIGPLTDVVTASEDPADGRAWVRFRAAATETFLVLVSSEDESAVDTLVGYTDTVAYVPMDTTMAAGMDSTSSAPSLDTVAAASDSTGVYVVSQPRASRFGRFELEIREVDQRPAVPGSIAVGDSVRGELGPHSALTPEDGLPYDVYTFRGGAQQRIRGHAISDVCLVEVVIGRWTTGDFVPLPSAIPDTALIGSDPYDWMYERGNQAAVTLPDDGEYAVVVRGEDTECKGTYHLGLSEPPAVPQHAPQGRISAGQEVRGTLTKEGLFAETGPGHDWLYSGTAGERLTVRLRSSDFDPVLSIGYMENGEYREIDRNDDTDGRASRITLTLDTTRDYMLRALSYAGRHGEYVLSVSVMGTVQAGAAARPAVLVGRIEPGRKVNERLEATDARLELDGSFYDLWTYRATRAGERIVVTLQSAEFDTFLSAGRLQNGQFSEFTRNDDAPENVPGTMYVSRLVTMLPEPGEYVIRVNTFGPDQRGAYVLCVERQP